MRRLPRAYIRAHDLLSEHAVEVQAVIPDSVADRAGFREGDLLVALNDRIVSNVDDVHRFLAKAQARSPVEATVIRAERRTTLTLNW